MASKKMTTTEAAAMLFVKPNTLAVWRCQGRGPAYSKIGRRILYDMDELERYLSMNTITPGAMAPQCDAYKH